MLDFSLQKKLHTADGDMLLSADVKIQAGQFVSIYGPSGAGKTSILRMLAGLMKPDGGYIKTCSSTWFDAGKKINAAPQQRNIGFVFQDYALFPNMDVRGNIAFALPKKDNETVDELLELTGLAMLAKRKTETLSGGQKQRVALARAIARKPVLLLLDEPLAAIDSAMRLQLQNTLLAVHKRFALTTILVSHDMDEIMRLCDAVIHLENGIVQQYATPSVFFAPKQESGHLNGCITNINLRDGLASITVLINTRIITIAASKAETYKPGDEVRVAYNNGLPYITKA